MSLKDYWWVPACVKPWSNQSLSLPVSLPPISFFRCLYPLLSFSPSSYFSPSLRPSCCCIVRVSCPSLLSESSGCHPSRGPRDRNFFGFVKGKYSVAADRSNARPLSSCYRGPREVSALSQINKSQWIKAHQRRARSKVHMKLIWHNQLTADSGRERLSTTPLTYIGAPMIKSTRKLGSVEKLVTNNPLVRGLTNAVFWMMVTRQSVT